MSLLSRLEKLESQLIPDGQVIALFIRYVNPDRSLVATNRYKQGGHIVERNPGETEDNFQARARREALSRMEPGFVGGLLFEPQLDDDQVCEGRTITGLDDDMPLDGFTTVDLCTMRDVLQALSDNQVT